MDRVDLQVDLAPVTAAALLDDAMSEPSETVAARVLQARAAAADRWKAPAARTNASVPSSVLRRDPFRLPGAVLRPATRAVEHGTLSARGFDRVLRVAWTISDLAGRTVPTVGDVAEAIQLRTRRAT